MHVVGFLIIAFSASNACAAGASPSKIDAEQARALVMASLTPKQRQLPSLGADAYNDDLMGWTRLVMASW
jgi:hypothetical protein